MFDKDPCTRITLQVSSRARGHSTLSVCSGMHAVGGVYGWLGVGGVLLLGRLGWHGVLGAAPTYAAHLNASGSCM
jgi:hypothetical protein